MSRKAKYYSETQGNDCENYLTNNLLCKKFVLNTKLHSI